MNFIETFGKNARWTVYPEKKGLPLVRKLFSVPAATKATLTICGLGFFEAYINGKRISEDYFKPCFSDYFHRDFSHYNYPLPGELSKHRIYVCRYDVTDLLVPGNNVLAVILAGGWLTQNKKAAEGKVNFVDDKLYLCFNLSVECGEESYDFWSDGDLRYSLSHIKESNYYLGEKVDFRKYDAQAYLPGYDDTKWIKAKECPDFGSPFYIQDVLSDRICETIIPKVVYHKHRTLVLDVGKNVSGWLRVAGEGKITVRYAESYKTRGKLNYDSVGGFDQGDEYKGLKSGVVGRPTFCFKGFRYAVVRGKVTEYVAEVLHNPFKRIASFSCDNSVLNWLFDAYRLTQLNNMHAGIPSDCPHREKLGYTADGQLTTETALLCFDSKEFYRKWLADILDCQDERTGHVHHTAPLMGGGGGPGGWGGAIVFAPYKYYSMFGEEEYIKTFLPAMDKWIRHMARECMGKGKEEYLIVRERKKGWCLGDWCTLEKIAIAEPLVNTYLFVKALEQYEELCRVCGKKFPYKELKRNCTDAIYYRYADKEQRTCQRGVQGADFFFADLGLLSDEEVAEAVAKYEKAGRFDVGIIGLDVLLGYLFKHGYADTAVRLLSSKKMGSFGYMKEKGASTLWERWDGKKSQDHPMYGSAVKYLFSGVAGIHYEPGFRSVTVRPALCGGLHHVKCTVVRPEVSVSVEYESRDGEESYCISYTGESPVYVEVNGGRHLLEAGKVFQCKKVLS